MRMSCRKCRTYLTGYVHNELTPRARRRVDAHLNECSACAAAYMHQQRTARDLGSAMRQVGQPNADRLGAIWAAVQAEIVTDTPPAPAKRVLSWDRAPLSHSAVLLALVVAILIPTMLRSASVVAHLPDPPTPTGIAVQNTQDLTRAAVVMAIVPAIPTDEPASQTMLHNAASQAVDFQPNYAPTPGATDSP